jgi:glycosyltransferase involved in cell wall biosynthesis
MELPVGTDRYRIMMIAPQPWFQPRGTPFSVLHRIKALTTLGHQVDLATYHVGQDVPMPGLRICRARPVPGVKQVKIGPSFAKIFLDMALYRRARAMLRHGRYDVLHTHEEAGFFGVGLARRFHLPHLYDMHSSLPQQLANFKFSRSRSLVAAFEALERRTITTASAVITICPELQHYVDGKFPDQTSVLIENVADNNIVFPADSSRQEQIRKDLALQGKRIVLYYGTLEPYQGIPLLLESMAAMAASGRSDIRVIIVGGHDEQVRRYQEQAESLHLTECVHFTGFVQPQLIPSYIDLADVLVSTRMSGTNSPLKIYSYLRSGKPVVATDHITHTQILTPQIAFLADPEPRAFAQAVLQALDDRNEAARRSQAARQLAEKRYSYQDYLRKTQWIVEQAVLNGPAS